MKKKTLFSTAFLTVALIATSILIPKSGITSSSSARSTHLPNCEELYKTRTSISDIIAEQYEESDHANSFGYATWGTVTAVYTQGSNYHAFIQNTGKDGKSAALCLYNLGSSSGTSPVEVGDFVTVSGHLTYFNGMYEINMAQAGVTNIFNVENTVESYPVASAVLSYTELSAVKGTTQWDENILRGNIRAYLENVKIVNISSTYATVCYADYPTQTFTAYFGGIGATDSIKEALQKAKDIDTTINLTCYLNAFDKPQQEKTQVLIKYTSDIEMEKSGEYDITDISLSARFTDMIVGEKMQVNANLTPAYASKKDLTWSSNNTAVATVDSNGIVTAKKNGQVTITARWKDDSSVSGSIQINVEPQQVIRVTKVEIDQKAEAEAGDLLIYVGDTGTFTCTVYPENATNKEVRFISEDSESIQVDSETGEWTALKTTEFTRVVVLSNDTDAIDAIGIIIREKPIPVRPTVDRLYLNCDSSYTMTVGDSIDISFGVVPYDFDYSLLTIDAFNDTWWEEEEVECAIEVEVIGQGLLRVTGVTEGTAFASVYYVNSEDDIPEIDVEFIVEKEAPHTFEEKVNLGGVDVGNYTSNFTSKKISGTSYEFYRAGNSSSYVTLFPSLNLQTADELSLPGFFSNQKGGYGIVSITINYSGAGTLKYGNTKDFGNSEDLDNSSSKTSVTIDTNNAFFFRVEANKGKPINVYDVTITYDKLISYTGSSNASYIYGNRIPATTYSGTLTDGVSYVDAPIEISRTGNNYTVTKTKRYIYYSYNYVQANKSKLILNDIAMTDPVDVANYYIAFKHAPANYICKTSNEKTLISDLGLANDVAALFGGKARYVSEYSKTDGYARAVPYYTDDDVTKPKYLEFDFDGGNYSLSARDVCRVVLWSSGWKGSGYGYNIPVAVYTDDHYATFREFNNYGGWNEAYDTGNLTGVTITNRKLGTTTTLTRI